MRVDAHQHFWHFRARDHGWMDPARHRVLMRDFLAPELAAAAAPHGIDAVVSVQARQSLEETDLLLDIAHSHPRLVGGVVGWVDLCTPDVGRQLERVAGDRAFKGVRHFISLDPDRNVMRRPDFIRGLRQVAAHGCVFDLLLSPEQLGDAADLAGRVGDLPMVLDHMGNPPIEDATAMIRWREDLRRFAKQENTYCKVSGYVTLGHGRVGEAEIQDAVECTLEQFGAARTMWGSDWPVCTTDASYARVVAVIETLVAQGAPEEIESIMGATAARFYSLAEGRDCASSGEARD